ncbi:MAG: tetratricopeptide repeat protein [Candidatus Obscuribacterales bacterium]|nr:tetratricopeptide repeat protein [Candidatus Obscuribacterales bacterium]
MRIELFSWNCDSADFAKASRKVERWGKRIFVKKGILVVAAVAAMLLLPGFIQASIAQNDGPHDDAARTHSPRGLDMAKVIENELKQLIVHAEASVKSKEWKKAEELYVQASIKDPLNKVVLHELALVYEQEGIIGQAIVCESRALRLDEKFLPAQQELAHLYSLVGGRSNADEHPKVVRLINPDRTGEIAKSTD